MKLPIKDIIASELEHFLLKKEVMPDRIKIEVWSDGCVARLDIDQNTLEAMRERGRAERDSTLPKVGDKLYFIYEDEDYETIEELTITDVGMRYIFFSAYVPPKDDTTNNVPISELGKSIFLTRELAEETLLAEKTKQEENKSGENN